MQGLRHIIDVIKKLYDAPYKNFSEDHKVDVVRGKEEE